LGEAIRASIAVCTRNRACLLQRCLASLDSQVVDGNEIEVLAVDNGSTDNTQEVLGNWQQRGRYRRSVREPRIGLSNARNAALEASEREIVIFVDDDALTPPAFAQAHLAAYTSGARVGAAGGPVLLTWPAGRPEWIIDELTEWYSALDLGDEPGPYPHPHGPYGTNMSVWRKAALELGGFNPRFGRRGRSLLSSEERDLSRRLIKAGWAIRYAPAAAVIQQVLPERLTRRWFLRRGWAQGISNARFEVLDQSLSLRHRLGHALAEFRISAKMFARRSARDRDELLVLTRVLAHASAALEFARLSLPFVRAVR
jgi:glucosyl-dolichyl phosphate glucuronosyltransferase